MTSRRLLPALTLAALLLPAYAEAQGPPAGAAGTVSPAAKAEAVRLGLDGKKALKEKRYVEAVKALQQAVDLDPNPQARLDLAEALILSSKLLEASRVLHAVADAPPNPATTKFQEAAKKSLAEIEPKIPWLQLDITGPEEGTAVVKVDGNDVDATSEIPLNPGEHKVTVSAKGFATAKRTITLEEGVHDKKKIKLKKSAKSDDGGEDGKEDGKQDGKGDGKQNGGEDGKQDGKENGKEDGSSSSGGSSPSIFSPSHPKFPAVLTAGGGGVALIFGAGFGFGAIGKASSARKFCNGTMCTPTAAKYINASKAFGNASTALLIIGGAAVATGTVLFFVLPDGKKSAAIKPTKDAVEPDESAEPGEPAPPPKKRKKKKKPVEPVEDAEPTEAFIAPYVGPGNVGVIGRF